MPTLYVVCGASGKTTFSRYLQSYCGAKLYCFDDLPNACHPKFCNTIRNQMWSDIITDLQNGIDVVCDDLHITKNWRMSIISTVSEIECKKILVFIDAPLQECLSRNANRKRRLPDSFIKDIYQAIEPPTLDEGWDEIIYHGGENHEFDFRSD